MHGAQKIVVPHNRLPHCKQFSNLAIPCLFRFALQKLAANIVPAAAPTCRYGHPFALVCATARSLIVGVPVAKLLSSSEFSCLLLYLAEAVTHFIEFRDYGPHPLARGLRLRLWNEANFEFSL
jgi:hypothetical protein